MTTADSDHDNLLATPSVPSDRDKSQIGQIIAAGDEFAAKLRIALVDRPDIGHAELSRRLRANGHPISAKQIEAWRQRWAVDTA